MKKLIICFYLMVFILKANSQIEISLGAATAPSIVCQNFENFDISDWQQYGLGIENGEGRVRVALKDKEFSGPTYGFFVLFGGRIFNNGWLFAKLPFTFGKNIFGFDGYVGLNYDIIGKKRFKLGIAPQVGYSYRSVSIGEVSVLSGYYQPVAIDRYETFVDGDDLSTRVHGFAYKIGIRSKLWLATNFFLYAEAGFGGALFGDFAVNAGGNTIDFNDAAIVKPDFSNKPADASPEIRMLGPYGNLGVCFEIK